MAADFSLSQLQHAALAESQTAGCSWAFQCWSRGENSLPPFTCHVKTETICASSSLANGWDMSWRVGQFDNTEAASQVTSPLSVGGKRPRIFSGSTFPVGDRPSSLGKEELDTGTIFSSDDSKHWPKPACLNLHSLTSVCLGEGVHQLHHHVTSPRTTPRAIFAKTSRRLAHSPATSPKVNKHGNLAKIDTHHGRCDDDSAAAAVPTPVHDHHHHHHHDAPSNPSTAAKERRREPGAVGLFHRVALQVARQVRLCPSPSLGSPDAVASVLTGPPPESPSTTTPRKRPAGLTAVRRCTRPSTTSSRPPPPGHPRARAASPSTTLTMPARRPAPTPAPPGPASADARTAPWPTRTTWAAASSSAGRP